MFRVREPVEKARLFDTLGKYDAGLFWAPMAELGAPVSNPKSTLADPNINRSLFFSAASNKVSEYIAAGLVVAYTGNPGLSFLPEAICAAFDPTDPEAGADQLAATLADRATVERKRQAALRYHDDEMNFEAQAAPFVRHVTSSAA
ncbi:MAG: glycosyltransferase family 4 protein [Hyphomicrobiaceae bacterium]|nr:MAG: glycosyltransferase family 4 protein [Hyphomicrobiaceae bacterium]